MGFVTTWYDQSGNGFNLSQPTAASQPQIVSSGSIITQNGQPTIQFITANSTFLATAGSVVQAFPLTVNMFAAVNSFSAGARLFSGSITVASPTANVRLSASSGQITMAAGGALTTTYPYTIGTAFIGTFIFNNTNSAAFQNGSTFATGASGNGGISNGIVIGYNPGGPGQYISANISAVHVKATNMVPGIKENIPGAQRRPVLRGIRSDSNMSLYFPCGTPAQGLTLSQNLWKLCVPSPGTATTKYMYPVITSCIK